VAVEALQSLAAEEKLPIKVYHSRFEDFAAEPGSYSGILLFGLIQELSWGSIDLLLEKVRLWSAEEAFIFVSGFTVEDPSFAEMSRGKQIGENSFMDTDDNIHTYLEPNEILQLFSDHEAFHHWEGLGPTHHHGDGSVRAVFHRK